MHNTEVKKPLIIIYNDNKINVRLFSLFITQTIIF